LTEYETVTSIHVYSLAPHPQKDLSLLADLSRSVANIATKADPLESAQKYGSILNSDVRHRDPTGKVSSSTAPNTIKLVKKETPAAQQIKQEPTPSAKASQAAKIKTEATEVAPKDPTPASSAGKAAPPPSLKRGGSGNIMQSFAKAASKPPKPKSVPKKKEEDAMALSDDGEADDSDLPPARKANEEAPESLRKSKKEREAELRRMMDDEDGEESREGSDAEKGEEQDEEMEDVPEPEIESDKKEEEKAPAVVVATSSDGRRRGKRRVTQKKRILDDQGYMGELSLHYH
jgi:DNA polymerase delta subunit 3